jgi:hypothetical protein
MVGTYVPGGPIKNKWKKWRAEERHKGSQTPPPKKKIKKGMYIL